MKLNITNFGPLTNNQTKTQQVLQQKISQRVDQIQHDPDTFNVADAMEQIWTEKTTYYGEHEIMTRTV